MKEYTPYTPEEREARNSIYSHILEARRCMRRMDKDGMGFHLGLAFLDALPYKKAVSMLEDYASNIEGNFNALKWHREEALSEARICALRGDMDAMFDHVKKAGSYRPLSYEEQGKLEDALEQKNKVDPNAETRIMPSIRPSDITRVIMCRVAAATAD